MGATMGLSAPSLHWQPASDDEVARLGPEGWPLLDYLLYETGEAPPPEDDPRIDAQRAALRALIEAAFGP
jgi:hypothetical protein